MEITHVVTYISENNDFGGPVTVATAQAAQLARMGHRVTILAGSDKNAEFVSEEVQYKLFKVRRFTSRSRFSGIWAPGLLKEALAAGSRGEMIHIHLCRDFIVLPCAFILGIKRYPYFVQTHGMIRPRKRLTTFDRLLTRPALRNARLIFSLTDEDFEGACQVAGRELQSRKVKNGMEVLPLRDRTQPANDALDILFLARLHERKNPLQFLDVAEHLLDTYQHVRFSIAGPDGGELPRVLERLEGKSSSRLRYEGPKSASEAQKRIGRADIYVLPSRNEPFPMTVIEALSASVPVIISSTCHIAKDLKAADAAEIFDGSHEDLERAVKRLIDDQRRRATLAYNGHRFSRDNYSIAHVAGELVECYSSESTCNTRNGA